MLSNRSTKTLIAVIALVAGILLTIKYIIDDTPLREWWVAGVLFVIAAALWLWMWQEDQRAMRASEEGTAVKAEKAVAKAEAAVAKAKEAVPTAPVAEKVAPPKKPAPVKAELPSTEEKPKPVKEKPVPAVEKPAPAEAKKEEPAADEVDDLTRIEGVGPKYRDALIAAGIQTFDQLAKTSEDELVAIVQAAKMRRAASMATWAEQAGYAARDDWEGLDKFQADLKGGRR